MTLSDTERLVLWNQYELLRRGSDEHEQKHYAVLQNILTRGLEGLYDQLTEHVIWKPVEAAISEEVLAILNMYRSLRNAEIENGGKLSGAYANFVGFDGNDEGDHYSVLRVIMEDLGRFQESTLPDLNSHHNTLRSYRRMLNAWKELGGHYSGLTTHAAQTIVDAA